MSDQNFVNSNAITVNLSNKDAGNQYILVFQKPFNVNEMYETLFPTAWKVIPLGNGGNVSITYPVEIQIMIKESAPVYDARNRGTIKESPLGQMWKFSVDGAFNNLQQVPDKTVDGLVGCINTAPQLLDIGIAKNGTTLVVKRKVSQDDQANFKLTPHLYFAYVNDLQEGELI